MVFKIVCIYYIICNGWNLYLMYYEIPVPWVHHNLCNGMECSKHSMVKSLYCLVFNLQHGCQEHKVPENTYSWYAKIIVAHVQCPNKLLENNDDHR